MGFILDSRKMIISAPSNKIKNIRTELSKFINKPTCSARRLASLLGKINALADALFPVRVYTEALQLLKCKILRSHSWDYEIPPSPEAIANATWWKKNLIAMNGTSLLPLIPDIKAETDASDNGWGARVEFKDSKGNTQVLSFGGLFTKSER